MEIKRIDRNNFTRDSLKGFQRYQEVKKVYRLRNGNLTLVDNPFTEDWNAARLTEKAEEILSGKFVTYGAFEGNRVVGEIMLVPGLNKGRLIIDSFHVSRDYRRHGIGRALFEAARQEALKMGAHALYASCCSSEETINFYSAMGFRLSPDPIPSLAEAEPYDLQMECPVIPETPSENMIRWAESRLGSTKYAGWCLAFIEDALEISNHIEIFGGDSAKESCEMYRDALRGGVPERGAFVFYDCLCPGENGPVNWGHCGISLGDGRVIHAWDIVRIDDFLAIEKLTALTGDHPKYLGWVPLERVLKQKPSEQ